MTPFEQAIAIYDSEPCFRTFDEDLRLHLRHGFVFSTPEFFVMGRPTPAPWVDDGAIDSMICDPAVTWPKHSQQCWHVHVMAGDMAKAWGILPWPLPYVSFQRKNELRFYRLDALRRLGTLPT
jgi:hypothetical protein